MGRDLFGKQFRDLKGSMIGWGLGLGTLAALVVAIYPSLRGNQELQAYWESLPEAVRALSGGAEALTSVSGYFDSQLFAFLPLILAIFTVGKAAHMLVGEEAEGTMDLTLAQPVPRDYLVVARFMGLAGASVVIGAAVALPLVVGGVWIDLTLREVSGLVAWTGLSLLLALVFGAVTLAAASIAHTKRTPILVGTVFAVGSYVLDGLEPLSDALSGWDRLSIYHWYGVFDPVTGTLDGTGLALMLGIIIVSVTIATVGFQEKDIGV